MENLRRSGLGYGPNMWAAASFNKLPLESLLKLA